jgi:hypothetical protein
MFNVMLLSTKAVFHILQSQEMKKKKDHSYSPVWPTQHGTCISVLQIYFIMCTSQDSAFELAV